MSRAHLQLIDESPSKANDAPAKTARARAKTVRTKQKHDPDQQASAAVEKAPRSSGRKSSASGTASAKVHKRPAVAADVMMTPAVSCHQRASLNDAVRLMWEHDVGTIVVINDHGRPVSMLTDRDACMAAYTQGIALYHGEISSAMSSTVVTCLAHTPVDDIRQLMSEHRVRRIPVVDAEGKLIGIVGLSDLSREAHATLPKDRKRGSSPTLLMQLFDSLYQPPASTT